MKTILVTAVVGLIAFGDVFAGDTAGEVPLPDLRLGRKANPGSHRGNDIYNQGRNLKKMGGQQRQRLNLVSRNGRSVKYYFSPQSDNNQILYMFKGRAFWFPKKLRPVFNAPGSGGNITAALLRGTWTAEFLPGQTRRWKAEVTPTGKPRGRAKTYQTLYQLLSMDGPAVKRDTNRVAITVK